jgi:phenylacetate-CoA ligase
MTRDSFCHSSAVLFESTVRTLAAGDAQSTVSTRQSRTVDDCLAETSALPEIATMFKRMSQFQAARWRNQPLWDRAWQTMSRQQLDEVHLRRIKQLIEFAYERVPFYREKYAAAGIRPADVRTWDDFYEHVPTVDKVDLITDQERNGPNGFGLEATPREARAWYHQTSGTTGAPVREVFTHYDRSTAAYDASTYGWWDAGLRPGSSMYFAFNFGSFMGFWSKVFAAERMGLMVIPGGGLDTVGRLKQIAELGPDAVAGTPTYLMRMGEVAQQHGIDLGAAGVRVLSTAGELGPSVRSFRAKLRELWGGARIVDIYGQSENSFGAIECRMADDAGVNGFHVIERYMHSYAGDTEQYRPVAPGEVGEHIVTTFRLGQPLIKYRTHDLVRHVGTVDHGCGWNFSFLEGGVMGRTDDMVTIKGTNVYTSSIQRLVGDTPGLAPHYELHITRDRGLDHLAVRVEAQADRTADGYRALRDQLVGKIRHAVGITVTADVLAPETLQRYELKTKRVFDHRWETS